jgi:acetyltransferase EpsM
MLEEIIIVGAGEHAAVVADVLQRAGTYHVRGFVDDDDSLAGHVFLDRPVLGTIASLKEKHAGTRIIMAIGHNAIRRRIAGELAAQGFAFISAIHPDATVSDYAKVEPGVSIMPQAVVNPRAQIAAHTIINSGAIVEHDCTIGESCHISVGAVLAGRVSVGHEVMIGAGATVLPHLSIGHRTCVGAGAVVTSDLPDNVVAMGVPARVREAS